MPSLISVIVEGLSTQALVDTGASRSFIQLTLWQAILERRPNIQLEPWDGPRLLLASTSITLVPLGRVELFCSIAGYIGRQIFGVIPYLAYPMFLGQNWVLRSKTAVWGKFITIKPQTAIIKVPFVKPNPELTYNNIGYLSDPFTSCQNLDNVAFTHPSCFLNSLVEPVSHVSSSIAEDTLSPFFEDLTSIYGGTGVDSPLPSVSNTFVAVGSPPPQLCQIMESATPDPFSLKAQDSYILSDTLGQELKVKAENMRYVDYKEPKQVQETPFEEVVDQVLEKADILDANSKETLAKLLLSFRDIFSLKPGQTELVYHTIDTTEARPVFKNPYPVSFTKREIIETQIREMLADGIVKPSMSAWASPVVLVKKPDGSERFCVDYRGLNAVTNRNRYPLPRMLDILHSLHGAVYLTTLDLTSGYWQVKVLPEDAHKTAFITHGGLHEFTVMPFGLCGAPGTFQRLMDKVLADLKYKSVFVYLDDIVIFSRTFTEHISHLTAVFMRLGAANLTVKLSKCHFCMKEMIYLGHIVRAEGIQTNPQKLEAVEKFHPPATVKEVQRFLGFAGWYRRHIPHYSQIVAPLSALVSPKKTFHWSKECQLAFDDIKKALMGTTILAFPDFTREFVLQTDASTSGLGAVLTQVDEGNAEVVIEYASRTLRKAELNYTVTELECLAVVWGCLKFRCYLEGNHFTVITDHKALRWLRNARDLTGRLTRWSLRLQEFDFDIAYRKGSENVVPDALSRCPVTNPDIVDEESDVTRLVPPVVNNPLCTVIGALVTKVDQSKSFPDGFIDLATEQDQDSNIRTFKAYLMKGELPDDDQVTRKFHAKAKDFVTVDNILYYCKSGSDRHSDWRPVIPVQLRTIYMEACHDSPLSGHLGIYKTYHKMKRIAYWEGLESDVQAYVRTCAICQVTKADTSKTKGLMLSPNMSRPMELWGIDLMGPFPLSHRGNRFVLVMVDYFSKWIEVFSLRNSRAATVSRIVCNEVFCRWDAPDELLSDNGPQFTGKLFKELCKTWGVRQRFTSPYHPQSDLCERINRVLGTMMRAYVDGDHREWDQHLAEFAYAYRSARQESTGFSPARVVLGREFIPPIARPISSSLAGSDGENVPNEHRIQKYVQDLGTLLNKLNLQCHQNQQKATLKQKNQYDKRHANIEFSEGNSVWLRNHPQSEASIYKMAKLEPKWLGPFNIFKKLNPVNYILATKNGKLTGIQHINNLKLVNLNTRLRVAKPLPTNIKSIDSEPLHRYNLRKRK